MPHDIKMTSMELSKKESRAENGIETSKDNGPKYPYGLRISLDDDALKKLGIKDLPPAGEKVMFYASALVSSSTSNDRIDGGKTLRMELQITDLSLTGKDEKESPAKKLYG